MYTQQSLHTRELKSLETPTLNESPRRGIIPSHCQLSLVTRTYTYIHIYGREGSALVLCEMEIMN
jgi:hypothetical protein